MYEQQGVQVAKEIQEAARAVVEENRILKAELQRLRNQQGISTKLNRNRDLPSDIGSGQHGKLNSTQLGQYLYKTAPAIEEPRPDTSRDAAVIDESLSTIGNDDITVNEQNHAGKSIVDLAVSDGETVNLQQELKRIPSDQVANSSEVCSTMNEGLSEDNDRSSCAFAVEVLTNMRAGVTVEDVRADLGCTSDFDKCSIKHSTLFNAVDRYT